MHRIGLVRLPHALFPHTGAWTLNEFVLIGGDATSDNLPPRFSQIQYAWRSPSLGIQQQIYTVLEQNARHVAAMTGCRASVRWITKTRVGLTNHAMTDLTFANMELVGPPRFPDEARDFARQIQANLGLEPMAPDIGRHAFAGKLPHLAPLASRTGISREGGREA